MTQKKRPQRHGPAASTIVIMLGLVVFLYGLSLPWRGGGQIAAGYDVYAGPIMPLTTVSGGEGLEARRNVDLDFFTYGAEYNATMFDPSKVLVTDTYVLTNTASEDRQVELAYPYVLKAILERGFFPTITVDGQEARPDIYFTMDTGNDFARAESFDGYKKLLAQKDYFATAMEEPVVADIPVKAYHFTDITYNGDRQGTPFLTLTFTIPKGVNVWTRHYDRFQVGEEKDSYTIWFQDDLDEKDDAWLFVANGDIENLTFGGNLSYNETQSSSLTALTYEYECDVTYEYEIVETTFADLMWKFAQEYDYWEEEDSSTDPGLITPEILYRDVMKLLGGTMGEGYDPITGEVVHNVEDDFSFTHTGIRLQYMVFPVTIPAGESITVEAQYWKEASFFFADPEDHREGYEIATGLGSDLQFTDQTATIQNTQWVGILEQDLGFAPDTGASQTTMDLSQERYYLVVSHTSELE